MSATIEDRIRDARLAAGLTQQGLAELMGIMAPNISRWESGKPSPSRRTVNKLAKVLHVNPDWLWDGGRPAPVSASVLLLKKIRSARENKERLGTVGARIRDSREMMGMSQAQLAENMGTTLETVQSWEFDEVTPRGSLRKEIGRQLRTNYEWLLKGEGPREAPALFPGAEAGGEFPVEVVSFTICAGREVAAFLADKDISISEENRSKLVLQVVSNCWPSLKVERHHVVAAFLTMMQED